MQRTPEKNAPTFFWRALHKILSAVPTFSKKKRRKKLRFCLLSLFPPTSKGFLRGMEGAKRCRAAEFFLVRHPAFLHYFPDLTKKKNAPRRIGNMSWRCKFQYLAMQISRPADAFFQLFFTSPARVHQDFTSFWCQHSAIGASVIENQNHAGHAHFAKQPLDIGIEPKGPRGRSY